MSLLREIGLKNLLDIFDYRALYIYHYFGYTCPHRNFIFLDRNQKQKSHCKVDIILINLEKRDAKKMKLQYGNGLIVENGIDNNTLQK